MENFDIVKYLKENHLGPHSILGGYVDLHALKEAEVGNNSIDPATLSAIDSWVKENYPTARTPNPTEVEDVEYYLGTDYIKLYKVEPNDPQQDEDDEYSTIAFINVTVEDGNIVYFEVRGDIKYPGDYEQGEGNYGEPNGVWNSKTKEFIYDGYSSDDEDAEELEEALDYNNISPERLKALADAGDFTAKRILDKQRDDADQRMKGQASNPGADGECEGNMYFHPQYGCIREKEEDLEGWKMVKKLATKDKLVAAAFLKPLVTVYGKKNVRIVKQGDSYKIYTKGKEELNNEADYGNNQPVDKVPYGDGEGRLDGFGDEFDQVAPVEEIQMAGENPWLNDSIDGEMIGDWTAYFAGQMGTIYLVHPLLKDLTVYATPGWEGEEGIAIAVVEDDVDKPWKNGIVPGSRNSYETFEEYAADMQSVLKDIENAYMDNSVTGDPGWEYTDKDFPIAEEEGMNDDDSENPFPSIIDDKTANMSHDDKFAYMGGSDIEKAVQSLMANNFKGIEIARFVVDTIGKFKK